MGGLVVAFNVDTLAVDCFFPTGVVPCKDQSFTFIKLEQSLQPAHHIPDPFHLFFHAGGKGLEYVHGLLKIGYFMPQEGVVIHQPVSIILDADQILEPEG